MPVLQELEGKVTNRSFSDEECCPSEVCSTSGWFRWNSVVDETGREWLELHVLTYQRYLCTN